MINDRAFRLELVKKSHFWFFHYYFSEYISHPTADFHRSIIHLTESNFTNLVIMAFRGSGKTTIITMSYVIWSILGCQNKKYVMILGGTNSQAREKLQDIKFQLENNSRLKADMGPFKEIQGQWGAEALILPQYEAKIGIGSTEQSIRGTKYNQYRPQLFILDDIETDKTVDSQEKRDNMYRWLTRDVLPAGDQNARMVLVGTPLHQDSVLIRVCNDIADNKIFGKAVRFPFFGDKGIPLWKEKFHSQELIDQEKRTKVMNDENAWQREFMLNPINEESQIIRNELIKRYDKIPALDYANDYRFTIMSIDPATGTSNKNDFTAGVYADVFGYQDKIKIYIRPKIFNKRIEFPQIIKFIENEVNYFKSVNLTPKVVVEKVGAQGYIHQQAKDKGIDVIPYNPGSKDKAERLRATTNYFLEGKVLFPKEGIPILENQIYGFGYEKYDDLLDALSMLMHTVMDAERDPNRLVIPSSIPIPKASDIQDPEVRKEEEKKVDVALMLESEYERRNFMRMMRKR
ncbi:hypothetical protein K8Q94_03310 [Candidatus Nomurabacteria bacterium]|nr:hypothetical protein [Candidatus Nomurabacteria bacterium]